MPRWLLVLLLAMLAAPAASAAGFRVVLDPAVADGPVTGRLIVAVARTDQPEPRLAIGLNGPAVFGIDVEGLAPGAEVAVGADAAAYPLQSLDALPPGDYHVQAVLVRYTQLDRADGHRLWLPLTDRRVPFHAKPGNLYSTVQPVTLGPDAAPVPLRLAATVPALPELEDTPWIRRVRIRSEVLSAFWGVPIHIGASVLLPRGFDENPDARYPVVYVFGHGDAPFGFDPDPDSHGDAAVARARDANVETGYEFAQAWQGDDFPRVVAITFEHPSPYFVESYAVDSPNNGPYGEALTTEIMPELERRFRGIGQPHARIVEGASTGGWEALALQLHYPDFFGGAWVFNPDPIDFRNYLLSDIYADENMFSVPVNDWLHTERPFRRTREGQPLLDMRHLAAFEAVLGSRGRSGYQLDIWQATHGPAGEDGYPRLLFDKRSGAIDREVAAWMRDNGYDLSAYARDHWNRLAPRLRGKLHLFAGEMDDFYLNLAVYRFERMLREVAGDDYPARFEYGRPMKGHNWHHTDWAGVVREMATHVDANAPTAPAPADANEGP
ncbi:alpha/beta hydrolase-fold protein [Luteimonas suaedae]|uniref:alpha/beta hydrolase-fold protein n=1 Tax=Luteimonas suaedae TaxID=2605430 RepID=UPI0011EF9C3B|nr:alpha/beta hydrolase-fold protein [Luteimonas suaedae]